MPPNYEMGACLSPFECFIRCVCLLLLRLTYFSCYMGCMCLFIVHLLVMLAEFRAVPRDLCVFVSHSQSPRTLPVCGLALLGYKCAPASIQSHFDTSYVEGSATILCQLHASREGTVQHKTKCWWTSLVGSPAWLQTIMH